MPVDTPGVGPARICAQQARREHKRDHRDRHVYVEDPLPRGAADDGPSDNRPEDRSKEDRYAYHRHHPPYVLRAGGLRQQADPDRHDHSASESLQNAEEDQRAVRPGDPTEPGADAEDGYGDDPDPL